MFERRWAIAMLGRVLNLLRDEYERNGKEFVFETLSQFLSGDQSGNGYQNVGETLHMCPEAVRVAAHRLRKRYRQALRGEIAHTTATPQEIDDEIRQLFAALRRN